MQTIIVDMTPGFRMPTIYYSQGDVGTQFAIDLRSRFGDSFPTGTTVTIQATKPSGFGFSVAADSITNGVATFATTAAMTDEFGRFPAELKVTKTGLTLFTANFYMDGERNTHPEGTIDGQQETVIPELAQLVDRVEEAASSVLDRQTVTNTLPAGSQATYSFDEETNTQTFGIPQGEAGAGAAGVVASAYSASSTYAVGDYVIHNSNLYRCTTAITTAESFTAAHWTQIVLADDVSDLKSDINANFNELILANDEPTRTTSVIKTVPTGTSFDSDTNTITIPANTSGGSAMLGYRYAIQSADVGKTIKFSVRFTASSGLTWSNRLQPRVQLNYVVVTNESYVSGVKTTYGYDFIITIPSGTATQNLDVCLFNAYYGTFSEAQSLTVSGINISLYGNTQRLEKIITPIETDVNEIKTAIADHISPAKIVPTGPVSVVKGGGSNASWDADTNTWTFPANTNCGGTSLGYRYTGQADDMGRLIRFIVSFNANIVNQASNLRPLVYWNYVDVTNQSYVSTEMHDDYCIFDITIPNERKNLDVRLLYAYYDSVGSVQTLQITGLEYYYLPLDKTFYTFGSNFIGKKLSPFGDSYTAQGKWQPYIKARLGLASYSGWSQSGGTLTSIYEEIDNVDTTADIVTVWIGTNDFGGNRRVGTLLDDVTDESIKDPWGYTTFCAALNYVCNWLSNNMKGKCIVFITPTQRYDSTVDTFIATNGVNAKNEALNNAGFALEDYADAMIEVANYWGYPVCDMYHESGINKNSYTAFYQADALHPSDAGAELLAQKIAEFINKQI